MCLLKQRKKTHTHWMSSRRAPWPLVSSGPHHVCSTSMLVFSSLPLAADRTAVSLITYSCGYFPSFCVFLNLLTFNLLTLVFVHPYTLITLIVPLVSCLVSSSCPSPLLPFSRRQPGCQMCLCSCESLPFTTWPFTFPLNLNYFLFSWLAIRHSCCFE